MIFAAIFAILVGVLMIGQWAFFLFTRQVPELNNALWRIAFHLAAEVLTAIALILGGAALLAQSLVGLPLTLLALGMLLYTVINSPGYFAQEGQWPLVVMFGILTIFTLASLILLVGSLDQYIIVV